ncbi:MAG TPA: asparagine synthase-related protein [Polyangia bacterium]|nr:asparagine synthase-related protein [Polyangia bacterium]
MFAFALDASFRRPREELARVRALLRSLPLTPPNGHELVSSHFAAAGMARWAVTATDETAAPTWDAAAGVLFAGDVRLYNRHELTDELGNPPHASTSSDLELARLAFARWGHAAPLHLVGDFAFAAWNESQRSLFVARDHLGVTPAFFQWTDEGVSVASDVQQFLPFLRDRLDGIDAEMVLDWFHGRIRDPRRTFFRGISRLRPGHFILADASGVKETRYWYPPAEPRDQQSYDQNCERLLDVFRRAVKERLQSDYPIVAHSSGGFDSSTIIMIADEAYRHDVNRPPLVLASAVAPGYPSDESRYMDAVAARVSFEGIRWNVVSETPRRFLGVALSAPVLPNGPGGGAQRDLEVARARGARVLMSGLLGDDVLHAMGVLRDFFQHGCWTGVLASLPRTGMVPVLRALFDAVLGVIPPRTLVRLRKRLFHDRVVPAEWMGPALRDLFPVSRPALRPSEDIDWPTHVAAGLWQRLSSGHTAAVVDSMVQYGREAGLEVRMPYADVRLVEEVFRFPWQQRSPSGDYRRTGKDSIGRVLPPEFKTRPPQPSWSAVRDANVRAAIEGLAPFIEHGPWLSAPFVDRGIARAALRSALTGGDGASAAMHYRVYEFGVFEAWLRGLVEYNPRGEVN